MKDLDQVLDQAIEAFQSIANDSWEHKPAPEKWSKKETLGHLVDSARNNLQRFTEVQHAELPYKIAPYQQDHLVVANGYQKEPVDLIMQMFISLNRHIWYVMQQQSRESLAMAVVFPDGTSTHLQWLMEDYIEHLQHHLRQILDQDASEFKKTDAKEGGENSEK